MINQERLLNSFIEMVEISSISWQERAFADFLKELFTSRGLEAEEDDAGKKLNGQSGNLLIRVPGTVDSVPLLFVAHMDTVVPGENIKAILDNNGIIRSKDATILGSDDKAGIAAIIEAYDVIKENNLAHPPLEILFTICEEQGLLGAKYFDYTRLAARRAYVLDSGGPPGNIVIESPCQNEIEYFVYGKPAHAGINPEDGINAIQIMSQALSVMPCGRIDQETTCNFGIIEGGRARNIVAESCHVKGEARSLSREKLDRITSQLVNTFQQEVEKRGARAETRINFLYPEIRLNENDEVVRLASRAAQSIGLETKLVSTGGGSDASVINGNNIPCANLGIGMSAVHTTEEFIKLEDLGNDARWIVGIIQEAVQEV